MSVQDNALQFTYWEEEREGIASGQGRSGSGRNPYLAEFSRQEGRNPGGSFGRGQGQLQSGAPGERRHGQTRSGTAGFRAGNLAGGRTLHSGQEETGMPAGSAGRQRSRSAGEGLSWPGSRPVEGGAARRGSRPAEGVPGRSGSCSMEAGSTRSGRGSMEGAAPVGRAVRQGGRSTEDGPSGRGVRPLEAGAARRGVHPLEAGRSGGGVRPLEAGAAGRGVRSMEAGRSGGGVRPVEAGAARRGVRPVEAGAVRRGVRPMEAGRSGGGVRPMRGRPAGRGGRPVEEPVYITRSGEGAGTRRGNRPDGGGNRTRSRSGGAAGTDRWEDVPQTVRRQGQPSGRGAAARRRRHALMQRAAIGLWVLCILVLAAAFMFRDNPASAAPSGSRQENLPAVEDEAASRPPSSVMVQGLPSEDYARHPEWTENFLTPNEYSRPGDSLGTVTSIFVHYTANPGTSAAQNRSYFEQQKDTHENSVSAHFIIGYEGEIIQCVPLDEIAYAVMTRNFDSISIECCYLAKDGSFTQETYDSLISLLAWLIDVYDLDTEDILRHYDCGGKKCPLYYTNHPGEWEQLKKDVDNL